MVGAMALPSCVPNPSLVDTANRQATGAILGGIFNPNSPRGNGGGTKQQERWEKMPGGYMGCLNYQGFFVVDGGTFCRVYKPVWKVDERTVDHFQPMCNVKEVRYNQDSPSQSRIIFQ